MINIFSGICSCVGGYGTCAMCHPDSTLQKPTFAVEEFDPRIETWEMLETFTVLPEAVAWFNSRKKGAVKKKLGFKVKDWKMRLVAIIPIAEK